MFDPMTTSKDSRSIESMDLGDNVLYMERKDPHGFIYLRLSQGNLPEKYQGAYTDQKSALEDANKYKEERSKAKEEIDAKTKRVRSRESVH